MSILLLIISLSDTLFLTLDKAFKYALKSNPELKMQEVQTGISNLSMWKSFSSYVPRATFTGSYSTTRSYIPWTGGTGAFRERGYDLSLTISQKIFSPVTLLSIGNNAVTKNIQELKLKDAKKSLYIKVLSGYIELLKAEEIYILRKKSLLRAQENLKLYEAKFALKGASKLDLLNAQVNLKQRELELADAEKSLKDARWALLLAMGIREEKELLLEDISFPIDSLGFEVLIREIERKKETYLAQKEERKKSFFSFLYTGFSFLPEISWNYYITYQDSLFPKNFSSYWDNTSRTRGFYLSLSFSFFDYPFDAAISRSQHHLQEITTRSFLFNLIGELEKSVSALESVRRRLALASANKKLAREAHQLSRAQYKIGKIPLTELLRAEENFLQAENEFISSRYDYILIQEQTKYIAGVLKEIK